VTGKFTGGEAAAGNLLKHFEKLFIHIMEKSKLN
jgi:hypothetical protein